MTVDTPPLDGVTVVGLEQAAAAPFATRARLRYRDATTKSRGHGPRATRTDST